MKNRSQRTVIGCILLTSLCTSAYMTLTNYMLPLSELLGVSVGQVSLIFTISGVASLVASLLIGSLLKKVKVKVILTIASLFFIAFHAGIYFANSITMLYVMAVLFGFATVWGSFAVCQALISWWVTDGVGTAMSSLSIGVGVTTFIVSPIVTSGINTIGVRTTALLQGLICGIVMLIATFTLISEHPSNYQDVHTSEAKQNDAPVSGLPMKDIVKTSSFWMTLFGIVIFCMVSTGFTNNAAALYQTMGVDSVGASLGISVRSVAQLAWAFAFGMLVDKKGPGFAVAVCAIVGAVTYVLTTVLSGFVAVVIIGALIACVSIGSNIGAVSYPRVFGSRESATLIGIANAAASIGSMIGAPVAAFMYDASGSFDIFLYVGAVGAVISAVLVWLSTSKKAISAVKKLESIQ